MRVSYYKKKIYIYMEKIKSIFLSQNNTRLINNTILTTLDLINLENEKKMVIVNILLKHMNAIFKQFDCNKINESNIKSINTIQ